MYQQRLMLERLAIYYRVSTDRQDLASQKVAIEGWLKSRALPPAKITYYSDEGWSGKTPHRPGFREMMSAAYKRHFDTIVVYRLDRFSRDAATAIRLILELEQHGVAFVSVTQPILHLNHDMPFRHTMLAAFAELAQMEREAIAARVISGLEAARQRGVKLGAPSKVSDDKKEQMLRLRAAGASYKAISKETGLSVGTVSNVLKGPKHGECGGRTGEDAALSDGDLRSFEDDSGVIDFCHI